MKAKNLLFCLCFPLIFYKICWADWSIQTVDSAGDVGQYTSIAIDTTTNNIHISYYDATNSDLKYASSTATGWSTKTIESSGDVGQNSSITLDSNHNSYIAYYDATNNALKYAKWIGSTWQVQSFFSPVVRRYISIAIDTNNNPHIAYYDWPNNKLKYAKWTGSSWSIQSVNSSGASGWETSITIDTNNNPHISYFDQMNWDLKYASWTGSSWNFQTIDSTNSVGRYTSIVLDSNNNPCISYYDATNGNLKYAKWKNNPTLAWTGETNYTSDGLDPEIGYSTYTYTYRVKYTDTDNDTPASEYPKVYIKKGGINISGSPFTMSAVDSNDITYSDGKFYTYSTTLSTGTDYTYYFEAFDVWNASATGTPNNEIDSPDVSTLINNSPTLSWTGETNYISDGLQPESGPLLTIFTYRVKYTDADNDASKSGYPKLYVKKSGINISSSPFTMSEVDATDTNYTDGKQWTYSTKLSTGTDYTYYFEAYDVFNASATGIPTIPIDAPDVYIYSGEIQQFKLYNNLFDPTKNEKVLIAYNLQEDADVKITIHDITGAEVKEIINEKKSAGFYTAEWNGLNIDDEVVASGLYIVYIQAGSFKDRKKVLVIK